MKIEGRIGKEDKETKKKEIGGRKEWDESKMIKGSSKKNG